MKLSTFAKGKGTAYIVVAHHNDGTKVTDHPTKKAAHDHAQGLRDAGVSAFAHPKDVASKLGLDPRDQPRDDRGRFSGK
jgi:hypothetical protein